MSLENSADSYLCFRLALLHSVSYFFFLYGSSSSSLCTVFDWDGLRDYLRDVPWEDIFKLSASAAASKSCEWVQVGIDVYISHRKYQVKPHSSSWFSAACVAAIVHRN